MENIILDAVKWVKAQSLEKTNLIVDGISFDLLALDEELKAELKQLSTYHEMLSFAADNGFYMGTHRAIDNEADAKNMSLLWELDIVQLDEDPCIKYRVGEKVCELSGLTAYIDDVNKKEIDAEIEAERKARELENTIDGDDPDLDLSVTIGQLQEDANKALV